MQSYKDFILGVVQGKIQYSVNNVMKSNWELWKLCLHMKYFPHTQLIIVTFCQRIYLYLLLDLGLCAWVLAKGLEFEFWLGDRAGVLIGFQE